MVQVCLYCIENDYNTPDGTGMSLLYREDYNTPDGTGMSFTV